MRLLSSGVRWWIQKQILELLGGFAYTGAPPAFLVEMVETFATAHPQASRSEWAEFSRSLVEVGWRAGVTSGWERAESNAESLPSTSEVEGAARAIRVALGEEEVTEPDPGVLHPGEAFDADAQARYDWWMNRAGVGPRPR